MSIRLNAPGPTDLHWMVVLLTSDGIHFFGLPDDASMAAHNTARTSGARPTRKSQSCADLRADNALAAAAWQEARISAIKAGGR